MGKLRLGVLASGRGSNLQAIMDAAAAGKIGAEVAVVISDHSDAYALERARQRGIPAEFVNPKSFGSKEKYEEVIVELLKRHGVELVCLAGYMLVVGAVMLNAFPDKILNIHPALLPAFQGLHGQEQAWRYGVKFSGCTVHFVDEGVDTGPIIIQAVVPVLDDDTADTLAARILEQEHLIYPEAIKRFAEGRLKIVGRKVFTKKLSST
ncbi:MAG: Phosphoribosylglycinamide formyltransferase [Pelotomaculum sp. PtaB.Bin013]|uniref:Phosphoribosylglycinamide formyltransferase n=1 Tax=Pelotomaculum isophthalicicum JI TaxID=947010 RepID=A0A9X4JT36_9FIRM|nr:phosphoribosylglycinamide formyltransferase [Pelotomaculum isophthalicicum]MDF9406805.1 phosphoribosylglycinamide formyltransferase [Pelotomaculum isophthalicicum JI]OPX83701.1 MAG: Phosphoribosylglycinamide formyltransferase [Pelotomaculum sp. PtaB.Bin013]